MSHHAIVLPHVLQLRDVLLRTRICVHVQCLAKITFFLYLEVFHNGNSRKLVRLLGFFRSYATHTAHYHICFHSGVTTSPLRKDEFATHEWRVRHLGVKVNKHAMRIRENGQYSHEIVTLLDNKCGHKNSRANE